jgi:hypothetical protein
MLEIQFEVKSAIFVFSVARKIVKSRYTIEEIMELLEDDRAK